MFMLFVFGIALHIPFYLVLWLLFLLFKTGFSVYPCLLELPLYIRLGLSSEILLLLPPASAGIKGVQHHHPAAFMALVQLLFEL